MGPFKLKQTLLLTHATLLASISCANSSVSWRRGEGLTPCCLPKFPCKVSCTFIPTEFQVKIRCLEGKNTAPGEHCQSDSKGVLLAGGASAGKALFLLTWEHQNDGRLQHPAGTQQGHRNLCTSMRVYICTEIFVSKRDLYPFFFSPYKRRTGNAMPSVLCLVRSLSQGKRGHGGCTRE